MKILCVDTSTRNNWVGLTIDNRLTDCVGYADRQSCLINLIPSIDTLLKNANVRPSELDGVITVIGPGAWSSLRIGIATVKSLCLVNQLPLIIINNLDLIVEMAVRSGVSKRYIYAAIGAQNDKVYGALYEITDGAKSQISPYQWEDVEKVSHSIAVDADELMVIGDAAPLFEPYRLEGWQIKRIMPQEDSQYLSSLGKLATMRALTYSREDVLLLKPLYIQPSSAEVEFKVMVT